MFWRFRYRTMFFVLLVVLLILGRSFPRLAIYPAAVSPFVALAVGTEKTVEQISGDANVSWNLSNTETILFTGIVCCLIFLCLLKRRPLCHTVCPTGYCFDVSGKAGKKCFGSNKTLRFIRRFPRLGFLFVALTLLGILFGSLTFLWLDPFVLFTSLFRLNDEKLGFLPGLFLVLLVASFFLPTFWCHRLCPLGATQTILNWPKRFFQSSQKSPPKKQELSNERKSNQPRRLFLFGFAVFGTGIAFDLFRRISLASICPETIRPPGSLPEPFFSALCSRCGNCIQACPTRLLKPLKNGLGIAMPEADFTLNDPTWCEENCRNCSQVCPTGAIRSFEIKDKKDLPFAQAVFEFEFCRLYDDIECSICARECPYEAITYQWSDEEYRRFVVIDAKKCTGCGWCLATCPMVRECGTEKTGTPLKIIARPTENTT